MVNPLDREHRVSDEAREAFTEIVQAFTYETFGMDLELSQQEVQS